MTGCPFTARALEEELLGCDQLLGSLGAVIAHVSANGRCTDIQSLGSLDLAAKRGADFIFVGANVDAEE
jgi:hypothetical protein